MLKERCLLTMLMRKSMKQKEGAFKCEVRDEFSRGNTSLSALQMFFSVHGHKQHQWSKAKNQWSQAFYRFSGDVLVLYRTDVQGIR